MRKHPEHKKFNRWFRGTLQIYKNKICVGYWDRGFNAVGINLYDINIEKIEKFCFLRNIETTMDHPYNSNYILILLTKKYSIQEFAKDFRFELKKRGVK